MAVLVCLVAVPCRRLAALRASSLRKQQAGLYIVKQTLCLLKLLLHSKKPAWGFLALTSFISLYQHSMAYSGFVMPFTTG